MLNMFQCGIFGCNIWLYVFVFLKENQGFQVLAYLVGVSCESATSSSISASLSVCLNHSSMVGVRVVPQCLGMQSLAALIRNIGTDLQCIKLGPEVRCRRNVVEDGSMGCLVMS